MSKDKQKYLAAYVPEVKPKETPKRSGVKDSGRMKEIEDAIAEFNDLLKKQNRDNLDAMYNIDMDNMSSSMRRLFQSYDDGISSAQSSIEAWANEMEAGFSAVAEWQKTVEDGTISSIAGISAKADENAAQITLLNQWKGTTSESLAAVETLASQNESRITALANWQSNTGEGLVESVAALQLEADETGAALELLVTYSNNGSVEGINSAKIAAAVSEEESLIELIADKVNVSGFVTYESLETDGETTINGNNISLIADAYGDSISELTFYKWRYTDDTEEDHTLDNMFRIRTIDNENDDENLARYAAVLQTLAAYEDDAKYSVALKLISNGAMSFESGGSLYASVDTYCTFDAGYNVRINAPLSYADACMASFGGYAAARNSYVFCLEGIYFINSDGNAEYIAGPS